MGIAGSTSSVAARSIEAVLTGQQPIEFTNESFKAIYPLPVAWDEQRLALGF